MLFNKNGKGTDEIRKHAGFLYASTDFSNIEFDINSAIDDLKEIVSPEIVTIAENHYASADYLSSNDETKKKLDQLVSLIQAPVAFLAIYSFQQLTDVAHEETGRKMKLLENEKIPFEWMLKKDDEAVLSRAYKVIERLIAFLETNITDETIGVAWKATNSYKKSKAVFINNAIEFDEAYPIEKSRRFYYSIIPFMIEVENEVFKPILSRDVFADLKTKILEVSELSDNDKEIIRLIKPGLAILTMKKAVQRLPLKVFPAGIFLDFTIDNNKAPDIRKMIINHLDTSSQLPLSNLQKFLDSIKEVVPDEPIQTDYSTESFFRL